MASFSAPRFAQRAASRVRGMHDLSAHAFGLTAHINDTVSRVATLYGFGPLQTPVVEHADLYERVLGNDSDVLQKEMFRVEGGRRAMVLRPEGTAESRAWQHRTPARYLYSGPFFRYERPQSGRLRQFHQFGVESFDKRSKAEEDAEMILLAAHMLKELGFSLGEPGALGVSLRVNTLGTRTDREQFEVALASYLSERSGALSDESEARVRTGRGLLRVLDSKHDADRRVLLEGPSLADFLSPESKRRFATVASALERHGVAFALDERLVRGLDYYDHTVFEFEAADGDKKVLGEQQRTLVAGGRYETLVEQLGGPAFVSGAGFAGGVERIAALLQQDIGEAVQAEEVEAADAIAVVAVRPKDGVDDTVSPHVFALAQKLRGGGFQVLYSHHGSVRRQLNRAGERGVRWAVVVGSDEMDADAVLVKNLQSGEQERIEGVSAGGALERALWLRMEGLDFSMSLEAGEDDDDAQMHAAVARMLQQHADR